MPKSDRIFFVEQALLFKKREKAKIEDEVARSIAEPLSEEFSLDNWKGETAVRPILERPIKKPQ
jgi:hypothetical protein